MVSHSLSQQIAGAQNTPRPYKPTEDSGHRYVVKQVNKVTDGDTFDAILVCTNKLLRSDVHIRILATEFAELRNKCIEDNEKLWETKKVLFTWLNEAKKIEVVIYCPK